MITNPFSTIKPWNSKNLCNYENIYCMKQIYILLVILLFGVNYLQSYFEMLYKYTNHYRGTWPELDCPRTVCVGRILTGKARARDGGFRSKYSPTTRVSLERHHEVGYRWKRHFFWYTVGGGLSDLTFIWFMKNIICYIFFSVVKTRNFK